MEIQIPNEETMGLNTTLGDLSFSGSTAEMSTLSQSRNRPRGSGVGKSIHKAAEAPLQSTTASRSGVLSKSQALHQNQPATPRISVSRVTVKDPPSSSSCYARKTTGNNDIISRISPVPRVDLATQPAMKVGFHRSDGPSGSESHSSENSTKSTSTSASSISPSSRSASCSSQKSCHYAVPGPIVESPPAPLTKAYEKLLAGCLLLQHKRRLPFLLRNLKKSFRMRCKDTGEKWPSNHVSVSYGEEKETVLVLYRYTDPRGFQFTFQSPHFVRECPLCSLMGILPSWSTLAKHLTWNHHEIEFTIVQSPAAMQSKIIIYLDDDPRSELRNEAGRQTEALVPEQSEDIASPTRSPTHLSYFEEAGTRNDNAPMEIVQTDLRSPSSNLNSQSNTLFRAFNIPSYHGPAEPTTSSGPNKTVSYRPDGPHLYDHLASLSLDEFGPLSWFVLDKEEETFELTDVLDEDKVMCALWGRWIIFNRPTFIRNYKAGVEMFLEQYWTMIYKAAGWASWRAFLLTLVSHRFLTNKEMVYLLKRFHEFARSTNERKQKD